MKNKYTITSHEIAVKIIKAAYQESKLFSEEEIKEIREIIKESLEEDQEDTEWTH